MRILIVDDHEVVRQGACRLLSTIADAEISEAATIEDALRCCRENQPNVIVLDISLRGTSGLEAVAALREQSGSAAIVIYSMHDDTVHRFRASNAGVDAYVCKSARAEDLLDVVLAVPGKMAGTRRSASTPAEKVTIKLDAQFSPRELEILRLLARGRSLSEIATELGTAYKTVTNTCSRARDKLGLSRISELVKYAIENVRS